MNDDDREDNTQPGGKPFLLCRDICPDSIDWICELQAGHPGRHEAHDGEDWWENRGSKSTTSPNGEGMPPTPQTLSLFLDFTSDIDLAQLERQLAEWAAKNGPTMRALVNQAQRSIEVRLSVDEETGRQLARDLGRLAADLFLAGKLRVPPREVSR